MDKTQVQARIDEGLSEVPVALRDALRTRLVTPYVEERACHDQKWERVWIVAVLREENICFGYAESGYEDTGRCWGLLFLDGLSIGDYGAWYDDLPALVDDCGYF